MSASSERRTERLGSLVTFKTGKLDSNAAVPNGSYPFFTCSQETLATNTFSFDTECILLAGNNANGIFPLKYFSGKFDAYQRTYVIRPRDPSVLSTRYLYFALRPKLSELRSVSTGAATKFLTLPILNETRIHIPLIEEQHRIASILGAYDDLIEVNRRRVALLENTARGLFEEWFVRFRFPGRESVAVIEAPGGLLPQGWVQTPIESAFSIIGGGTPSKASPDFWDGGSINWFTPSDLTKAKAMFLDVSGTRITPLGLRSSSANLFPPNSIMMTSRATLGVIAINSTAASTNQGFITCIPNARVPLAYLYHWLGKNVPVFISYATGATFKEITKGVFKKLLMNIPPETLTQAFEKVARPMLDTIQTIERSNRTLAASRDLLLPRLISGQLSVKAAERKFEEAA